VKSDKTVKAAIDAIHQKTLEIDERKWQLECTLKEFNLYAFRMEPFVKVQNKVYNEFTNMTTSMCSIAALSNTLGTSRWVEGHKAKHEAWLRYADSDNDKKLEEEWKNTFYDSEVMEEVWSSRELPEKDHKIPALGYAHDELAGGVVLYLDSRIITEINETDPEIFPKLLERYNKPIRSSFLAKRPSRSLGTETWETFIKDALYPVIIIHADDSGQDGGWVEILDLVIHDQNGLLPESRWVEGESIHSEKSEQELLAPVFRSVTKDICSTFVRNSGDEHWTYTR
jgi:hypothetical protein